MQLKLMMIFARSMCMQPVIISALLQFTNLYIIQIDAQPLANATVMTWRKLSLRELHRGT